MDYPATIRRTEIVSIQYLRAIAAMMIVVFHIVHNSHLFENFGIVPYANVLQSGVDVFFVVSGFIMWHTTRGIYATPRRFILNRLIRIVPIYWLVTLIVIAVALARPDLLNSTVFNLEHAIASILFIPWPHPVFPAQYWPVVIPGWSLNYEMFFYAIFAICLMVRKQYSLIFLVVIFALVIVGASFSTYSVIRYFYGDLIILEFLYGALIGALISGGFKLSKQASMWLMSTGVLFLALSHLWDGPRFLIWGLPALALVAGAVFYELSAEIPNFSTLKHLGDASYSVYLLHGIVVAAALKLLGLMGPYQMDWPAVIVFSLAAVVASCVVGLASYRLVEKPANRILRHWVGSGSPAKIL